MSEQELPDINAVIDEYADMVYRIALTQMKNVSDAQDVFQEVFLRLVKHLPTLHSEEHIKAWLIRVTINCSKSSLTSAWRRHTEPLVAEEMLTFETSEQLDLYEHLSRLPKKYRIVLYLFYYEELSIKEIADYTAQKETTVKSQLSRARALLKKEIGSIGGVYE
ncbi:MAG: sigma-70 family RNA polymerase sigma factor [bacterium]|nr:sigma-70 family RNA polymerase sigma factor [bacterium]